MTRLYARAPRRSTGTGHKARQARPPCYYARRLEFRRAGCRHDGGRVHRWRCFLAFLQEVLVPQLHPGQIRIMDTLKAHKVAGRGRRLYCCWRPAPHPPPYSPDFSLIEECWSKVKAILRATAARTLEALEQAIAQALAAITSQEAYGWFDHAGYCVASN